MTIVMVDLEGTLSDNTRRLATLKHTTTVDPRDREAWKKYYKGLPDDPARHSVVMIVREWIREGFNVIVYSTRFINKYEHEKEWLKGHELWEHVELLQRRSDQTRIEGPDLVGQWVKEFEPTVLIDDREEVRMIARGLGVSAYSPEDFDGPEAA